MVVILNGPYFHPALPSVMVIKEIESGDDFAQILSLNLEETIVMNWDPTEKPLYVLEKPHFKPQVQRKIASTFRF